MNRIKIILFFAAAATLLLTACKNKDVSDNTTIKGLDLTLLDSTVNPGDDFFDFFNRKWIAANEIPAEELRWGPFVELRQKNLTNIKGILEEAAANTNAPAGSNEKKVGDFYASGMDSAKANELGIKPLNDELTQLASIKDKKGLVVAIARLNHMGANNTFGCYVGQDDRNSESMILSIAQGGLSLPSKEYYNEQSAPMKEFQQAFKSYAAQVLELSGEDKKTAEKNALTIYEFEKKLAAVSMNRTELRDIEKQYNKMDKAGLAKLSPNFDWELFFNTHGIKPVDSLLVNQLEFIKTMDAQFKSAPLETWKTYLRFKLIDAFAPYLSDAYSKAAFEFYDAKLSGAKKMKPRWKIICTLTDQCLGDALGQLYVAKYFTPESKQKVNEMVDNLIAVYKERIDQLDWMGAATKVQAKKKLETIEKKLGYPDKWKDYSKLEIDRNTFVANIISCSVFASDFMYDKLGKPVDRSLWGMTPPTVNAYYNPSMNEIAFPAGIMQPPMFTPDAPDVVNYAAIGMVIGHELTHGFDDQGSQFDEKGNFKNWWTAEDQQKFKEKTALLVGHYNDYVAIDTLRVNGQLTLGENIADLGGLTIAYYAWKKSLNGKPTEMIAGYTQEQLFFMSFAQVWRMKMRDEVLKQMLINDPHSPAKYRINGPLSNMKEFYEAWNVKPGNKMYREEKDRAKIW